MKNCNVPMANKQMFLEQYKSLTGNPNLLKDDFSTDENGYFEVEYIPEHSGFLGIGLLGGIRVLDNIRSHKNLDLGDVYCDTVPADFIIHLDVHEPYTENDTLIFRDFNSTNIFDQVKIPGPFNSGILDTIINYGFIDYPISNQGTLIKSFRYSLHSNNSVFSKFCDFRLKLCEPYNQYGDAVMIID